ncbi:hypothetical protein Ddye_022736 [Dipteronia dyeriana]|uniref:FHA domain-containing protein n=1 Tax=Dipteronia dyeriana TaxID=168575 RepID=A0AAD9TSJ1_9ROSI|nr:hypothetical protein Ddye_022736 [Dipteronia dyeriana]
MEIISQSQAKALSCSTSIIHSKSSHVVSSSIPFQHSSKTLFTQLQGLRIQPKKHKNIGPIHASDITSTTDVSDTWLLQPVGDGDTKHIGFKVKMPDAFEIASSVVTVGRLPEKADMVIPVATVSGVHARIQKKGENLLVTDLDSTNGTFVDNKRIRPGVVATVSSGSYITFGDTHLAMFRVSKLEKVEAPSEPEESEDKIASPAVPALIDLATRLLAPSAPITTSTARVLRELLTVWWMTYGAVEVEEEGTCTSVTRAWMSWAPEDSARVRRNESSTSRRSMGMDS